MRRGVIRAAASGAVMALLASSPATLGGARELSGEEARWLDGRMSERERAVLDTLVGYAPPEFPEGLEWVGSERVTLDGLRGKVVVLQTWTRKSVAGRAAPTRAVHVLEGFSPDDVRVIAVHTPDGSEGARMYLDRRDVDAPVVVDDVGAYCDELGAFERPVTLVLDRQGAVRYAGVSITGLPRAVERLVGEPFDAESARPEVVASRDERDRTLGLDDEDADGPRVREGTGQYPAIVGSVGQAVDLRGRKGPPLYAQQWLTRRPQTEGKVIVAEFWATWCGPCIRGIPHLNELQAAFPREVVVAGISDEPVGKVRSALPRLNMKYSVGADQSRRMRSVIGNRGIPHAIVMSPDGIVRWQGHPQELSKKVLGQVVRASSIGESAGGGSRHRWTSPEG